MADPRQRTPEEREAARRERERQRDGGARPEPRGPTVVRTPRPPRPTRRAQPPDPPPPHPRRRRIFAVIALVLAVVLVWFLVELFQPLAGGGNGTVTVV